MSTTIIARIQSFIGKSWIALIQGRRDSVYFFDHGSLTDQDRADLVEYFFQDTIAARIEAGELIPVAVLGLTENPDSFAELNHGGALVWEVPKGKVPGKFWYASADLASDLVSIGSDLTVLDLQAVGAVQEEAPPLSDIEVLNSPPYKERWDRLGDLYRDKAYPEAMALCEALLGGVPCGSDELSRMRASIMFNMGQREEALTEARSLFDGSLGDLDMADFLGSMQLDAEDYSGALATAGEIFDYIRENSPAKIQARAHALRGIALHYLGRSQEAQADLAKAKDLHGMVTVRYPQVRTLMMS